MLPILAEIGAKFQLYGFVDRREFFTDAAPTGLRGGGACFSTEMPPLRGLGVEVPVFLQRCRPYGA